MSSTNMSRRALVAGVAAVPAATVLAPPIIAATADAGPDPIYAVIEKYRIVHAAFLARCRYEDDQEKLGNELILALDDCRTPEMVAIVTASIAARAELANSSPTTLAGLAAHLDLVLSLSDELEEFFFQNADDGDQITAFVRSLERAARKMAAEQAASHRLAKAGAPTA
jgi:hypothetical protein